MELSWKSHGILFYTFRGNPAEYTFQFETTTFEKQKEKKRFDV